MYKGEISKSGVPILPSKRARKIPEKIQVSNEDLQELQNTNNQPVPESAMDENDSKSDTDVSIEELKDQETLDTNNNSDQE